MTFWMQFFTHLLENWSALHLTDGKEIQWNPSLKGNKLLYLLVRIIVFTIAVEQHNLAIKMLLSFQHLLVDFCQRSGKGSPTQRNGIIEFCKIPLLHRLALDHSCGKAAREDDACGMIDICSLCQVASFLEKVQSTCFGIHKPLTSHGTSCMQSNNEVHLLQLFDLLWIVNFNVVFLSKMVTDTTAVLFPASAVLLQVRNTVTGIWHKVVVPVAEVHFFGLSPRHPLILHFDDSAFWNLIARQGRGLKQATAGPTCCQDPWKSWKLTWPKKLHLYNFSSTPFLYAIWKLTQLHILCSKVLTPRLVMGEAVWEVLRTKGESKLVYATSQAPLFSTPYESWHSCTSYAAKFWLIPFVPHFVLRLFQPGSIKISKQSVGCPLDEIAEIVEEAKENTSPSRGCCSSHLGPVTSGMSKLTAPECKFP